MELNKARIDALSRDLIDRGKVIEAGWLGLRLITLPPGTPDIQVQEMRKAFFCGAQHLFASIIGMLSPGTEPTQKDFDRMTLIMRELEEFVNKVKAEGGLVPDA